ncbi:MAG: SCO family protein [Chitinophagales bacterium]
MLCRVNSIFVVLAITTLCVSCGYLDATKQRVEERKDDGSALPDEYFNTAEATAYDQRHDSPPEYDSAGNMTSPIHNIQSATRIAQGSNEPIFTITPKFELVNQLNEAFHEYNMTEGLSIVTFFFTRCPSICPTVSGNLLKVQNQLSDKGDFQILSISVDPKRDSVTRLLEYSKDYNALPGRWDFLTGDSATILTLYRKTFKLPFDESMGKMAYQAHSSKVFLVRNKTDILGFYDGTNPEEMKLLVEDALRFIE